MAKTEWQKRRKEWVGSLSDVDLMRVVGAVAAGGYLDETDGDRAERADALIWLTSRGTKGKDWGIPPAYAEDLGLYR